MVLGTRSIQPWIYIISRIFSQIIHVYYFIFQYPVRPCTLPNDPETTSVMDSRIKPNQQKVELTIGLNASCPNYDKSKGEQIALNVDGSTSNQKSDDEITYGRGIMDRITLSSQKSVKDPSRYAVGIFNGSELHITPLKGKLNIDLMSKSSKSFFKNILQICWRLWIC